MYNLEQAITDWRRQMQAAGVKTPVPLVELEGHLRDDVEEKVRSGLDPQAAFTAAVGQIGEARAIQGEFGKTRESGESRLVKLMGLAGCTFAGLFTLWAAPWFLTNTDLNIGERALGGEAVALTVLAIVSLRFSPRFLPVIRNAPLRLLVVSALAFTGLAGNFIFGNFLTNVIWPYFGINVFNGQPPGMMYEPMFITSVSMLWSMALTAGLCSLAYGLASAVRQHPQITTA